MSPLPSIYRIALLFATHLIRIGDCHSAPVTDCTRTFCQLNLSDNLLKRYKITVPDGNTDSACGDCKITVQLELDGYSWIGVGVSQSGGMVGSHVVIGEPGLSEPKAFYLNGKDRSLIEPSDIILEDATIDFINGQTVMEFTTSFSSLGVESPIDREPAGISLSGKSSFIWAHGNDGENMLKYHGANKATYEVNDLTYGTSSETDANKMTMSGGSGNFKSKWLAHGILAFISWGMCAPVAIAAAILRDFDGFEWFTQHFSDQLSKWWFYIHVGCNSLNYFFTMVVFSLAVSTIKREGSRGWYHAHNKMGLAMFLLATFQIAGGVFRPAVTVTEIKTKSRQLWELAHGILGIMLFLFGVWQMYAGMVLYKSRYDNSNFIAVALFYIIWMGTWTALIVGATIYKWKNRKEEGGSVESMKNIEDQSGMENENRRMTSETPAKETDDFLDNEPAAVTDSVVGNESEAVYV